MTASPLFKGNPNVNNKRRYDTRFDGDDVYRGPIKLYTWRVHCLVLVLACCA